MDSSEEWDRMASAGATGAEGPPTGPLQASDINDDSELGSGTVADALNSLATAANGLNVTALQTRVIGASGTATLNRLHVNVATATYTDPTPSEGAFFEVLVVNGTATVGGTAYSTAGNRIVRVFHSGAWTNYRYAAS
jgi:hypothetical protein